MNTQYLAYQRAMQAKGKRARIVKILGAVLVVVLLVILLGLAGRSDAQFEQDNLTPPVYPEAREI